MAIPRGYRFDIEFDSAFPQGLVLIGDVAPDNEYQTREDKAIGRPVRQKVDQVTGKRQWKATVTDPDESTAKRASFEITLIAEVQPVPTTTEVLPGMRPIELNGPHARQDFGGGGNRLHVGDQRDFKRGPLGCGLARVGDRGLPLPLTRHLIDFLSHGSAGGFVLARLVFIVWRDVTDQN